MRLPPYLAGLLLLAACAPALPPMSAADHLAVAGDEDREASRHREKYQAELEARPRPGARGSLEAAACALGSDPDGTPLCRGETPLDVEQLRQARAHERDAERHRAAAAQLLATETEACRGVPARDRDDGPFWQAVDVDRVDPLLDGDVLRGASIVLRSAGGRSIERLQRIVDCHVAHDAALAAGGAHRVDCPLALPGVRARVVPMGSTAAVLVSSQDRDLAAELLVRARAIPSARPTATRR